jgi:hypothetical protein
LPHTSPIQSQFRKQFVDGRHCDGQESKEKIASANGARPCRLARRLKDCQGVTIEVMAAS